MNRVKTAVLIGGVLAAAAAGGAMAAAVQGAPKVARAQARALEMTARGGRIGIAVREVDEAAAKGAAGAAAGVVVEDVSAESPAEQAGIRKGDVIVEFDGERVRSVRQFIRLVQETPPGRTVQVALQRDGRRTTLSVTPREGERFQFHELEGLGELGWELQNRIAPHLPLPPAPPAAPAPPPAWDLHEMLGRSSALGITVHRLSPQLAEYFGTKSGVLVAAVADGSAAAKAGVKAGDVITAVNAASVDDPGDVRRQVQELESGEEFTLSVVRDRKAITLKGKAERPERRRLSRVLL